MSAIRHFMTVVVFGLILAGCEPESDTVTEGDTSVLSVSALQQKTDCERKGGRWGAVQGGLAFACFRDTRDGGKSCLSAQSCEGLCLARSRTCAPVTPFFGCHEVFTSRGLRQTICIN